METAAQGEVKVGEAQILSTVDGSEPQLYDIRIDKIRRSGGEERYQLPSQTPTCWLSQGVWSAV